MLLPKMWEVPGIFRERLGDEVGRQRIMVAEDHLLIIVHELPSPDESERQGLFFWRDPGGTWHSSDSGKGASGVSRHLDTYQAAVEELEKQERAASSPQDYFQVLQSIVPIHRATAHLKETLQAAREAEPKVREIINWRDRAVELDRAAELIYSDARYGLEFVMARATEAQSRAGLEMASAAHRLNLLVAFFFPIVTLCAIFGVNLEHGWETRDAPWPFFGLIGVGLIGGFILKSLLTKPGKKPAA